MEKIENKDNLKKINFNFKKHFGQNFIFDTNLLKAIVNDANVENTDEVLEIGAGAGTLTQILAQNAKKVISYEIDKTLTEYLQNIENQYENLKFVFCDFMKESFDNIFNQFNNEKIKVVANLPYYITTPIIFRLLEKMEKIDSICIMVQKEVAERIVAKPNTKDYGILSCIIQSIADTQIARIVSRTCFTPAPNVDSAILIIKINKGKYKISDMEKYSNFIKNCFSMRRKTLINNLSGKYNISKIDLENLLVELEFNKNARAESLSIDSLLKIFNNIV